MIPRILCSSTVDRLYYIFIIHPFFYFSRLISVVSWCRIVFIDLASESCPRLTVVFIWNMLHCLTMCAIPERTRTYVRYVTVLYVLSDYSNSRQYERYFYSTDQNAVRVAACGGPV